MIDQGLPILMNLMGDPSTQVRDTTAWALGRICETSPEVATNQEIIAALLNVFCHSLTTEPSVAANVCWVRTFLFPLHFFSVTGMIFLDSGIEEPELGRVRGYSSTG